MNKQKVIVNLFTTLNTHANILHVTHFEGRHPTGRTRREIVMKMRIFLPLPSKDRMQF